MSGPAILVCFRAADTEPADICAGSVARRCGACDELVVVSRSGQALIGRDPGVQLRCVQCAVPAALRDGTGFETVPGGHEEAAAHFAARARAAARPRPIQ